MKISNCELLKLIWAHQVKIVANKVFVNYLNGQGVDCRGFGFPSNRLDPCFAKRIEITDQIGATQLRKRIKALIEMGELKSDNPHQFSLSHVCDDLRNEMANTAIDAWLALGVPRHDDSVFGEGSNVRIDIVDYPAKIVKVEKILLEKYAA
jgi:hypothetical protein